MVSRIHMRPSLHSAIVITITITASSSSTSSSSSSSLSSNKVQHLLSIMINVAQGESGGIASQIIAGINQLIAGAAPAGSL